MRIPTPPPHTGPEAISQAFEALTTIPHDTTLSASTILKQPVDDKGRYLPWDEHRRRADSAGLTTENAWHLRKLARRTIATTLPLLDQKGRPFWFVATPELQRSLHTLDAQGGVAQTIGKTKPVDHGIESYLVRSLVEEPLSSATIEGAMTTRARAQDLILNNAKAMTIDDVMVINNYLAMKFVGHQKDQPLSIDLICELQAIVAKDTLHDESNLGVFRSESDRINVVAKDSQEILYTPPAANDLEKRLDRLCHFMNNHDHNDAFIHPIVRAIILHFMIAYEHPFVDGNGRTARALFFWSLIKDGYWLMEYAAVSKIILEASNAYGQSFLHTEQDESDLTYFIVPQAKYACRALEELHQYLDRKQHERAQQEHFLAERLAQKDVNARQAATLTDLSERKVLAVTIHDHRKRHGISYLTARKDLQDLEAKKLLTAHKEGQQYSYRLSRSASHRLAQRKNKH